MLRAALPLAVLLVAAPALGSKPEDFVGLWGVTMTTSYSTCKTAKVADVKSEEWNFNVEAGRVKVVTLGGTGTDARYEGELSKDGSFDLRNGTMTGVQLKGDTHSLRGTRVAARLQGAQPCAIIYELKLSKK